MLRVEDLGNLADGIVLEVNRGGLELLVATLRRGRLTRGTSARASNEHYRWSSVFPRPGPPFPAHSCLLLLRLTRGTSSRASNEHYRRHFLSPPPPTPPTSSVPLLMPSQGVSLRAFNQHYR